MLKKIMIALTKKLKDVKECDVYVDNVMQGFKEPCFFVKLINSIEKQELVERYRKKIDFCIHYFPKEKSTFEIIEVAEKMLNCFEKIESTDFSIGIIEKKYEIVDNVLLFFIGFDILVLKEKEKEEFMEVLIIKNEKGGENGR